MKKMLALCMAMLLSLAMLAGCSSADPNHPMRRNPCPPTTLRLSRRRRPPLSRCLSCSEQRGNIYGPTEFSVGPYGLVLFFYENPNDTGGEDNEISPDPQ